MATISVQTNIAEVSERLQEKLNKLKDKEYLLRPVCFDLIELMKLRIHEEGKNASGSQIGTYDKGYLALRQKKYQRSGDTKIIVSLTRQLENDWSVIATERGYGIGFKNPFNLFKARSVEGGAVAHTVKAHTRVVKTKDGAKKVDVSAYQNKGWKGHGPIFSLTEEENKYASDLINILVAEALGGASA